MSRKSGYRFSEKDMRKSKILRGRAEVGRPLPTGGAAHVAPIFGVLELGRAMHGGEIVPHQQVAELPAVPIYFLRMGGPPHQHLQQVASKLDRPADDV